VDGCAGGQGHFKKEPEVREGGGELAESVECVVQEEGVGRATVAQVFEVKQRCTIVLG
jgi:hypothetical protein